MGWPALVIAHLSAGMVRGAVDPSTKFDRQSRPIALEQWAKLHENPDYRFVQRTRVGDIAWVITIWEGMDPYRLPQENGPNLIFETSAFKPSEGDGVRLDADERRWRVDGPQRRHGTEEEALKHHGELVAKICLTAQPAVVGDILRPEID